MNKISLVVLAGGLGSRYNGQKQIDSVGGEKESLMEFALYDAIELGIKKVVFIINNQFPEEYKDYLVNVLGRRNCSAYFVEQTLTKYVPEEYFEKLEEREKPLGTAHAVYCGKDIIKEPFITMNADDFYGKDSFAKVIQAVNKNQIDERNYAMVAFELKNTLSKNGSVSRGICAIENGKLIEVEEFTNIEKSSSQIEGSNMDFEQKPLNPDAAVSMNFWVLHPSFFELAEKGLNDFFENHSDLNSVEFYLPEVIDQALKEKNVEVKVLSSSEKWFGLTYKGDKVFVKDKIDQLKAAGKYPTKLWGE